MLTGFSVVFKGFLRRTLAGAEVVPRDECNDYHGVTVERAQYILQTMGVEFRLEVEAAL
jgi:hypothetical protein